MYLKTGRTHFKKQDVFGQGFLCEIYHSDVEFSNLIDLEIFIRFSNDGYSCKVYIIHIHLLL